MQLPLTWPPTRGAAVRRWVPDAAVALAVLAIQVAGMVAFAVHRSEAISPAGLVLLAAAAVALVARRRFPVAVLAVTFALTMGYTATSDPGGPIWLPLIVAFGTAVYYGKRVAAIASLVVGYAGYLWVPALVGSRRWPSLPFTLGLAAWLLVLLLAAEGIRLRHLRSLALARGHEEEVRRRTGEERLRIARELHDVVAHHISLINVQANTALHLADRQPDRARAALATINDVSKQALAELRGILGVLRGVDEDMPRAPSPSLGRLGELVDGARAAGLAVHVEEDGTPAGLPANVDLAAYRIIQESLTNAARHAAGSTVTVRLRFGQDGVGVEVDDDGDGGPSGNGGAASGLAGAGSGIAGMAERAQALGGTLRAAPRPYGGFRVQAWLPFAGEVT